jgi:DNA replication and repair protein RecF
MRLSHLSLRNFRNISTLEINPHQTLNFFVGENAQGKTSLIEAIYLLSTLKSFRTGKLADLIQMSDGETPVGANVVGLVAGERKLSELVLKVRLAAHERKVSINDKLTTSTKFVGNLRTVLFSPESLTAIKGGPEQRRDLIDQASLQIIPNAYQMQKDFSHALKQRNALLRQMRDGEMSREVGSPLLAGIDETYMMAASNVIYARLFFLTEIEPFFNESLSQILGQKAQAQVIYKSADVPWDVADLGKIKSRLCAELIHSTRRVAEESLGSTLTGPHRHDISILFNGNDSRFFCSQGQQRALILAFKIAEIMYHRKAFESYPLLLLDDVLSEFDENKRGFLIEFLRSNEAQTFLTTTDQTQAPHGSSLFKIKDGKIIAP